MKRILVIADPPGGDQKVLDRAVALARSTGGKLTIVGFVYEHIANLPLHTDGVSEDKLREKLLATHRRQIADKLAAARGTGPRVSATIAVHWEKRVAEWVVQKTIDEPVDLVIKGAHRSETMTYTPTDWQLLRGCRCPVMLVAAKRWKKSENVLAAVDLGTRRAAKKALNRKVVAQAAALADALGTKLVICYAVPFSRVLRDLDIVDEKAVKREAGKRLADFCDGLAKEGIAVNESLLVTGAPEKALVNAAAKSRAGLVVLGTVGRKRLAGKVIGNTAEQILRLTRADVLAIRPD